MNLPVYPGLSVRQQKQLPELIHATALPMQYSDSTHQLWDCDTEQEQIIVKVCNSRNVARSTFWQGMNLLFGTNLPEQLGEFELVYKFLSQLSPLTIPKFIAAGSVSKTEPAFIAVKKVPGKMLSPTAINTNMVEDLAGHIAKLHQHIKSHWGQILQPQFAAEQWPLRLLYSLQQLAKEHGNIPRPVLNQALELAANIKTTEFAPGMPDLRWDQFLQRNGKLTALVDLDAFVFAPRELELVLLEYLLDDQQALVFAKTYQQIHTLPNLTLVRKPYRLLLFLMNVLGEKNLEHWMQAANRF